MVLNESPVMVLNKSPFIYKYFFVIVRLTSLTVFNKVPRTLPIEFAGGFLN